MITILRQLTVSLQTRLQGARGAARISAAAATIREARLALEPLAGEEVDAVRGLLAALEAGHRSLGDADSR